MRGEHWFSYRAITSSMGSSPHARGAHKAGETTGGVVGVIPACAGSTERKPAFGFANGGHPRMRGEHGAPSLEVRVGAGSSPHARGAPGQLGVLERFDGVIPACAGSTLAVREVCEIERGHPRMRGEHARID